MQGQRFGDNVVYLYGSWLFTQSPILCELYCESHRHEPWLIRGAGERYGRYMFPNALYIPHRERTALLDDVKSGLLASPAWAAGVQQRVCTQARALVRLLRNPARTPRFLDQLLHAAAQVLSVGAIKEALEPEAARALLRTFVADSVLQTTVLSLYQPHCLPHYDKVEAKVLFYAARYLRASPRRRKQVIRLCIEAVAHHSRFLLEPSDLANDHAMAARFAALVHQHRTPTGLRRARLKLLQANQRARVTSMKAERTILLAFLEHGPASLHARRTLMGLLRMVQFVATWEELKHILVMDAAREIRRMLDEKRLPVTTTAAELRDALKHR